MALDGMDPEHRAAVSAWLADPTAEAESPDDVWATGGEIVRVS